MKNNHNILIISIIIVSYIIGFAIMQYDDFLMKRDLGKKTFIEFGKSLRVKKRFVNVYRDGRTKFINDSIHFELATRNFENTLYLDDSWPEIDSLMKKANSDTLKCVLYDGSIMYFKIPDPLKENKWD